MLDLIRRRRLPIVRGDASLLPLIHIEDAVAATIRALEAAPAGGVYDVVDDRAVSMTEFVTAIAAASGAPPPRTVPAWLPKLLAPYVARMTSLHLPLSNAAAKQALGWRPRFRDFRDALGTLSRRAA
jgi:nucleoside-diphosphate-sugar epimerase